ncbi:ATP-binding protein [Rubellicoccus peritrichatus]|uniref:histidine kinase n=1 Tax=Rubellicoccus peritrichatus TaxID=3080537 RepID=A0AAQ3LDD8_9BACT|nr:ATP-binding protein [Puniceicoccus sp. CR14]WOO41518.1 response regulator [Puniceicoccus sp. CR14]
MKVFIQLLIVQAILLAGFFLIAMFVSQKAQTDIGEAELGLEQREGEVFDNIVAFKSSELGTFVWDYSWWQDLVDWIDNPDPEWVQNQFDKVLYTYNADFFCIYDSSGKRLTLTLNPDLKPLPKTQAMPLQLDEIVLNRAQGDWFKSAFEIDDFGIKEVYYSPVQPQSDIKRDGPHLGYLAAGRYWNDAFIDSLESLTGATILVTDSNNISEAEDEGWSGSVFLERKYKDYAGNEVLTLGVYKDLPVAGRIITELTQGRLYLLLVCLLVITMTLFALYYIVSRPLKTLSIALESGNTSVLDRLQKSRSEYGSLANLIKENFLQKQRLQEEIAYRRESEENLRITLDSIGDAVIATDTDGRIIRMNPIAERLTGCPFEEAKAKPFSEILNIVDGRTREKAESSVEKVLATGEIVGLAEHMILISRDGTEYHVADSGAPIRSDTGQTMGVVLVFRDITEEYGLQEQLQQSQKMEAIGQLAGGVAHDFNNMLACITSAAEMLKLHLSDKTKLMRYHRMIMESTERASGLTQKLLVFARKQNPSSEPIDLHEIIHATVALLENTIDRRIQIKMNLKAEMSTVICDASQLESALLNLCVNASHAMPDGGVLGIESEIVTLDPAYCEANSPFDLKAGQHIQIKVSDTGCGMPMDVVGHIFEPFFTTKEQGKGTGLGLSIVFGTIKQHNGAITVYSEVGVGTCFHILLPLADTFVSASENTIESEEIHGSGCILVVDDEPIMQHTAEDYLQHLGYDVLLANDGQAALELFKDKHETIDLVLLDMIMPHMSGRDCFIEMQKIDPKVKVVLSSGFCRDEDINELMDVGLCGFIGKPYRTATLSHVVSRVMQA